MTTNEIIKSFRQGGTGNCVSIAVIKASIQIFGLNKVVHFEDLPQGGCAFIMKDGFEGVLTVSELNQAISCSKFKKLDNTLIFDYANHCFAAMAKRALIDEHEGAKNLKQAIDSLNNGEYYYLGADWLGLKHHKRAIGLKYVWNNIGVVGASSKHCFFCSEGIVDKYGVPDKINLLERIKYRFFNYYRISEKAVY